ncbi:MAG: hypothetical protein MZV64_34225 [Ignavibacteriales bacterium]|nr:hypothetical protein [Ignavibacteriales bacterium]
MNLFKRLEGLFFSPAADVRRAWPRKPVWIDAVVIAARRPHRLQLHHRCPTLQKENLALLMKDNAAAQGADGRGQLRQDDRADRAPLAVPAGSSRPSS